MRSRSALTISMYRGGDATEEEEEEDEEEEDEEDDVAGEEGMNTC